VSALRGKGWALLGVDCLRALAVFPAGRFDSVVTDPPYELGFMGKGWDASGIAFSVDLWREVLRVLKPGGHLLAFGGTRTYHRMTCAIEDAGFEIRDSLHFMYGTGFPKSLNVGGGRGTALKPGHEPIVLARKPLEGTVAANVAAYGTGALNIDGCRIGYGDKTLEEVKREAGSPTRGGAKGAILATQSQPVEFNAAGRWPANVLLDEDAAEELDAQSGECRSSGHVNVSVSSREDSVAMGKMRGRAIPGVNTYSDKGGASRFFYVAKPSRKERDLGCEHLPAKSGGEATDREDGSKGTENPRAGAGRTGGAKNFHPTVKPVELMRYLCRLVTPPGGVVLDPFAGSCTTGAAAMFEGLRFVGIERAPEYAPIARARLQAVST
jgi:hypothetical protein